jgi:hypothetical protein
MKSQSISSELVTDDDFPGVELLEQVTEKDNGSTVSLFVVEGDALMRKKQIDLDLSGAYERDTVYSPGKLRFDESEAATAAGATFDDVYTATVNDATGAVATETTDRWEVIGVDVACSSPYGEFQCIHVRVTRTVGGVAVKDFFFAPGVGKVREEGQSQLEELTACSG